jgi:glycosyltransferase involved in cell wall biosynthesis
VRSIHAPRSLTWSTPQPDAFTVPAPGLLEELKQKSKVEAMLLPALVGERYKPAADRAALRAKLGIGGEPVIGMVSTFQPSRHHDIGLDAFALLAKDRPNAQMVLLGDGELEWELRARVAAHGSAKHVTFAGYQAHREYLSWLQAFDEVWVLGLGNDWAGRAAAQARACGVRVLAIDEGGLAQYADVVATLDAEAIVNASMSGRRREVTLETPAQIAARVLELYARVTKK